MRFETNLIRKIFRGVCFLGMPLILLLYLFVALGYILRHLFGTAPWGGVGPIMIMAGLLGGLIVCARRLNIYWVTAIAFVLYAAWGFYAGTEPFSDFGAYYIRAQGFMADPSIRIFVQSKSPTTIIFYGFCFTLIGASHASIYIINALAYAAQIPLIHQGLVNFGAPSLNARFSAVLYGFLASTIVFAPVISSECVFSLLAAAGFFLLSLYPGKAGMPVLLMSSLVFGMLFLTRSTGLFFFLGAWIYLCFAVRPFRMRRPGLFLIPFCACLAFQGTMNWIYRDTLSFSSSPWHHLNILTGTNKEHGGRYNVDDIVIAGYDAAALNRGEVIDHHEAMKQHRADSREIAWRRIREDIPGFLVFALTEKVDSLWKNENYALYYATRKSRIRMQGSKTASWGYQWLNCSHALLTMLGVVSLGYYLWHRGRFAGIGPDFLVCLIYLPSISMIFVFLWVEVGPRYHHPFMMLFSMGSVLFPYFMRDLHEKTRQLRLTGRIQKGEAG